MTASWIAVGALLAAVSVIAGAFGAHALEQRVSAADLVLWETGARYLMYAAFSVILYGLFAQRASGASSWPALCLVAGGAIFSGTLFSMSLGAPRWFGAITPIGGLLLIVGLGLFAWSAMKV